MLTWQIQIFFLKYRLYFYYLNVVVLLGLCLILLKQCADKEAHVLQNYFKNILITVFQYRGFLYNLLHIQIMHFKTLF